MKKPTLVVMAAGMGSRFGGLKQMTPIDPQGNSIIQYSLYDARLAGFDKVVFIIKHEIEHDFREKVGDDRVILALSGGVDSSVVAALGARAVGKQMTCVFINHGLLRKGEPEQVEGIDFGKVYCHFCSCFADPFIQPSKDSFGIRYVVPILRTVKGSCV